MKKIITKNLVFFSVLIRFFLDFFPISIFYWNCLIYIYIYTYIYIYKSLADFKVINQIRVTVVYSIKPRTTSCCLFQSQTKEEVLVFLIHGQCTSFTRFWRPQIETLSLSCNQNAKTDPFEAFLDIFSRQAPWEIPGIEGCKKEVPRVFFSPFPTRSESISCLCHSNDGNRRVQFPLRWWGVERGGGGATWRGGGQFLGRPPEDVTSLEARLFLFTQFRFDSRLGRTPCPRRDTLLTSTNFDLSPPK